MAGPTEPKAATFEARVIDYIWRAWRDTQSGTSQELEGVGIRSVAVVVSDEGVSARVEWIDLREDGQPSHVTEREIAFEHRPEEIGDDIVWAIWAKAHGTS